MPLDEKSMDEETRLPLRIFGCGCFETNNVNKEVSLVINRLERLPTFYYSFSFIVGYSLRIRNVGRNV